MGLDGVLGLGVVFFTWFFFVVGFEFSISSFFVLSFWRFLVLVRCVVIDVFSYLVFWTNFLVLFFMFLELVL